jgi:3-oxoacyl-[acyl-carrier protein] reductase
MPWGADPDEVDAILTDPCAHGARAAHLSADLAAPTRILTAAVEAFGHMDILIANHARSSRQTLEELAPQEIDLSYAVNTRATLLLVREFAAQYDDDRDGGGVVWMTFGLHRSPMPGELPYIVSKGALHKLTVSLVAHLAPRRITVNWVDPGATDIGT